VILFWGSWCDPCVDALEELEVVASERPDITFITVLIEDQPDDARAVMEQIEVNLAVVDLDGLSDDSYSDQWGSGVPLVVLVEADGTVAAYHLGVGPLDLFHAFIEDADW
jgi:thiol-disulfide isomerase/thioredoxin